MQLSLLARVLWATTFCAQVALLLVLITRKRWRVFRFFTLWIVFQVFENVAGFFILSSHARAVAYNAFYWGAEVIDLALQVCVILEIARIVLKPTGTWVRDALKTFVSLGIAGVLFALALSYIANPRSATSLDAWIERGNLFSAMLSLELFIAMGAASTRLGLVWRNHVMGLAVGWSVWAVVDFFVEGALSYLGPQWWHGMALDQIRIIAFQLVTIYWAIIFWLPEPEERILSPEMKVYLSALHEQVQLSTRRASSLNHR
jgi:hypothetical protein